MNVYIDPRTRISYASFYIEGLFRLFGKSQVKFSKKYFCDLIQSNGIDDFDHYFAFVVVDNSNIKRIVIDYRDKNSINLNALNWCNIYGKVNYNEDVISKSCDSKQNLKIVAIGSNFGIKIWNNYQTLFYLIRNYLNCYSEIPVNLRSFIAGYNWQRKRPNYDFYTQSSSESDFVFFVSTLYPKGIYNSETNLFRASFIKACKLTTKNFEGGLFAKPTHPEYENFKGVITSSYVQPAEYLSKVKKSAVVFNTPAVWGCLGWKLGEFLAMGKAIISTPLTNRMPFPLIHGKHIHFVNSEEEIVNAVRKIMNDPTYRKQLEEGARDYFNEYLSPETVLNRLIEQFD